MKANADKLSADIDEILKGKDVISDEDMLRLRKLAAKNCKHFYEYNW